MKALPLTTDRCRHLAVRVALLLLAVATIGLTGASQASAATTVVTVGNPAKSLPVAQWVSEINFPTPDVTIRVHYEDCPGGGQPLACAGALNGGAYDLTITDRWEEFGDDYLRSTIRHEVGHIAEAAYFGDQTRSDFAHYLGYPSDRTWFGDLDFESGASPTWVEPAEWFAEAYTLCTYGYDRPQDLAAYGFNYTYRQVLPLCQQISLQMTGQSIERPPAPKVPVLCSPRCQVKLGANDRFVAANKLVPGTVSAVLKYGKKVAMLDRGCKGKVKLAGDFVYLNFCSGRLRATTFSYRKFKLLWWGQTPSVTEPAALPVLGEPRTSVAVDGGGSGPFPLSQWVAAAKVATPRIDTKIVYGQCVHASEAACTSSYATTSNFIWLNTAFLGSPGKDTEYYRALFYRSVAAFITRFYLGPEIQRQFKVLLGISPSTSWGAYDASIPPTTSTPAKLFAEAYATCAWGGDRPAATVSFGFDRSYSSLKPVCDRINQVINGDPLVVAPIVQPPAPACGSLCSTKLSRNSPWSTALPSPPALAVVKFGKRFAALPSGCSGTVRVGRAAVRLNYCGSTLRAKAIGRGTPELRFWNQPG